MNVILDTICPPPPDEEPLTLDEILRFSEPLLSTASVILLSIALTDLFIDAYLCALNIELENSLK